jgi:hypothetical protein
LLNIFTFRATFPLVPAFNYYTFFEAEQEKVRYFTERLGIDKKYLPAKRYGGAIRESLRRGLPRKITS